MLEKLHREKRNTYFLVLLWGIVIIAWKVLNNFKIINNSALMEEVWWAGLLLLGSMILGFIFQPMIKEIFPSTTNLKDNETLLGYYPVVALVVLLGGIIFSPFLYGAQTLFIIKSSYFWWSVFGTGILNVFIFYLFTKALRYGDISLVSVTQSLGPIFLLPISFLIFYFLKDRAPIGNPNISFLGGVGIFATIVALIFDSLINKKKNNQMISVPKGDWLASHPVFCGVLATFIGSVAQNFDKVAIDSGNPFLMGVLMASTVSFVTLIWTVKTNGWRRVKTIYANYWKKFLIVGGVYGLVILIMNITLVGHNVNYYGAIKRSTIIFGAFYGLYVLKEGANFKEKFTRLLVSIIVFASVILILMEG